MAALKQLVDENEDTRPYNMFEVMKCTGGTVPNSLVQKTGNVVRTLWEHCVIHKPLDKGGNILV